MEEGGGGAAGAQEVRGVVVAVVCVGVGLTFVLEAAEGLSEGFGC